MRSDWMEKRDETRRVSKDVHKWPSNCCVRTIEWIGM